MNLHPRIGANPLLKKRLKTLLFISLILSSNSLLAAVKIGITTSFQNSGLFDYLQKDLEELVGEPIHVIAVGTGRALELAKNGDVDLVIVHSPALEEQFVAAGIITDRKRFMYNQFMVVGPQTDPAHIASKTTLNAAFLKLVQAIEQQPSIKFVSRGDNSGTHIREQAIWSEIGARPAPASYLETGSGQGATLNVAVAMQQYALTDSATWLAFQNKGTLTALITDPRPINQYSVSLVPQARYPKIKAEQAKLIAQWLISAHGQDKINHYQINGEQAFIANAGKDH